MSNITDILDIENTLSKELVLDLTKLRRYIELEDFPILFEKTSSGFVSRLKCVSFGSIEQGVPMQIFFKFDVLSIGNKTPRGWLWVSMTGSGGSGFNRVWTRVHVDFHVYGKSVEDFITQLSMDIEHVLIKPHQYFPKKFLAHKSSRLIPTLM